MAGLGKRLTGAGYVVLNVIRAMNIIALLAVVGASAVMLVKTFNNNTFFFFDACEHVIRVTLCGFLILTESSLFKQYWKRKWPLFSQDSGFVMLGISMLLIGNSVLANLNKTTASQTKLGMPFWRLVIASGIVIIVMGAVNVLASYIFRDSVRGLTARQVRSDGATAPQKAALESAIAASTPKSSRRSWARSMLLRTEKRADLPPYRPSDISRSNTTMTQRNDHQFGGPLPPANAYTAPVTSSYNTPENSFSSRSPPKKTPFSPSSSKYSGDSRRDSAPTGHPAYGHGSPV